MIASIVKKFIIRGFLLLLLALIAVVVVFLFVQYQLLAPIPAPAESGPVSDTTPAAEGQVETLVEEPVVTTPAEVPVTAESEMVEVTDSADDGNTEGVSAGSLPLTEGQRKLLAAFDIDPDTIEITPAMIACAEDALGPERYQEIIDGATPGLLEGASLLGCLGSE